MRLLGGRWDAPGWGGRLGDPQALSPSWVPPNCGTLQWREASSPHNAQAVSGPAVTCVAPQIQEHEPTPPTPGAGLPTGWWEERGDGTDGASPTPGAVLGAPDIHPVTLHCPWDGITVAISQTREQHLSKAAEEGGEGLGLW